MTDRILGELRTVDGEGVLLMQDRFATDPDDLWSALVDPERLARWYGVIEGELRVGAEHRRRLFASGWEGVGEVLVCEPPTRLVLRTRMDGGTSDVLLDLRLTAEGDGTLLVLEQHGLPLDHLPAYGAGMQVHVEDLGAHLSGGDRCDASVRFEQLFPQYQALA